MFEADDNLFLCIHSGIVWHSTYQRIKEELHEEQSEHISTKLKLEGLTIQLGETQAAYSRVHASHQGERAARLENEAKINDLIRELDKAKKILEEEIEAHQYTKDEVDDLKTKLDEAEERFNKKAEAHQLTERKLHDQAADLNKANVTIKKSESSNLALRTSLTTALQEAKKSQNDLTTQHNTALFNQTQQYNQQTSSLRTELRELRQENCRLRVRPTPTEILIGVGGNDVTDVSTWEGFTRGIGLMQVTVSAMNNHWKYHNWPWGTKGVTKKKLIALRAQIKGLYP